MAWNDLKDSQGTRYLQADAGTTGTVALGNADSGMISSWVLHVNVNGSTVAMTPKVRVIRALAANAPLVAINYQKLDANPIDISGTAISASGIYVVRCDGMELTLDLSTHSGGSGVIVYPYPLQG